MKHIRLLVLLLLIFRSVKGQDEAAEEQVDTNSSMVLSTTPLPVIASDIEDDDAGSVNETALAVDTVGDGSVVTTVVENDGEDDDYVCESCNATSTLQEQAVIDGDYEDDDGNEQFFGLNLELDDAQLEDLRKIMMDDNATKTRDETSAHTYSPESYLQPVLQKAKYDKNSAPKIFADLPVDVRVGMRVNMISDFDAVAMKYATEVEVLLKWRDVRLKNNFKHPILLKTDDIIDSIWRPDPFFPMSRRTQRMLDALDDGKTLPPNRKMIVDQQGIVSFLFRVTLIVSCPMVFCRYPHDEQVCELQMASNVGFVPDSEEARKFNQGNRKCGPEKRNMCPVKNSSVSTKPEGYIKTRTSIIGAMTTAGCMHFCHMMRRNVTILTTLSQREKSFVAYDRQDLRFRWFTDKPMEFSQNLYLPELQLTKVSLGKCELQQRFDSSCIVIKYDLTRSSAAVLLDRYMPSAFGVAFAWVSPFVPYDYCEVRVITPITKDEASETDNEFEKAKLKARAAWASDAHKKLDVISRIVPLIVFIAWCILYFLTVAIGDQHYCIK